MLCAQGALRGAGHPAGGCVAVSCGESHTVALCEDSDGERAILSWGQGEDGQLGLGDRVAVELPTRVQLE